MTLNFGELPRSQEAEDRRQKCAHFKVYEGYLSSWIQYEVPVPGQYYCPALPIFPSVDLIGTFC